MPRSASVSVPRRPLTSVHERRTSLCLEDYLSPVVPRDYDSWPCDSFFLLPDSVLSMDASAFRDDLRSLDPVLSDSLPDWSLQEPMDPGSPRDQSLMDNHTGLKFHPVGQGTVLIGGGGDGRILPNAATTNDATAPSEAPKTSNSAQNGIPAQINPAHTTAQPQTNPTQKDCRWSSCGVAACLEFEEFFKATWPAVASNESTLTVVPEEVTEKDFNILELDEDDVRCRGRTLDMPNGDMGPNALFFEPDRASGLCFKDREERVRQLREKQQNERHQKLEELKEQAASAQKFREQQETHRRHRLDEMRQREQDRRVQVEERRRVLESAEQERREASLRRNVDREQRIDLKRRQEKSNAVFAFGSSTPRMLDPKETSSSSNVWGSRRATSTTNVNVVDSAASGRRTSECIDSDLSRKRATSAHSLNRKPDELRMSSSMYEVFHWDDNANKPAPSGDDLMTQSFTTSTVARRRTDLFPALPSLRDANLKGSRHRSPGVSGATTPGSPSRPTSALSSASGAQVLMRARTTPRKQRPLSIAGSVLSSADKPRESASAASLPGRESRPIERKSSTGSSSLKHTRAKSVDNKNPPTSKPSSRGPTTPKRTPAQVKADSAARKAVEKSKAKTRPTPRSSPSVDSKPLPGAERKISKSATSAETKVTSKEETMVVTQVESNITVTSVTTEVNENVVTEDLSTQSSQQVEVTFEPESLDDQSQVVDQTQAGTPTKETTPEAVQVTENVVQSAIESSKITTEVSTVDTEDATQVSDKENRSAAREKVSEKPGTGYATEEAYKQVLAEKRRQAREARDKELELERQKVLEAEEKERREEEEYLLLMQDQRKAEEERLEKAIEEASKLREEEAKVKEEEEKQRIEAEKLEKIKQAEHEEKMKKEEEERQARKSRVAQIMARTRGKGTPKADDKSPDENRTLNDSINMSESFISNISSSMTDSMIVNAIESREDDKTTVDTQAQSSSDASQPSSVGFQSDSGQTSVVSQDSIVFQSDIINSHTNGASDSGPTIQTVDLLESFNGSVHNGVQNGKAGDNTQFDSLDPLSPQTPSKTENGISLDQIIDLSQMRVSNEDAINSNHPAPIIAFEENINNKQHQDTTNVPDLLL